MTTASLIVDALAVHRLTRLATVDHILAPVRERIIGRKHAAERNLDGTRMTIAARPRLAELLACPWCMSLHLAIGVTLMQALAPNATRYVAYPLAFSSVAGLLSERR